MLQVLQHWLQLLQQGEQLRLLTQQLQHLLAQRSSSSLISTASGSNGTLTLADTPITSTGETMNLQQLQQLRQQALQQVEQLLHVESAAVAASDVLSAAEGLMVEQPEGLLQQLLAQVQHLFDIPSLQGIPAAMNKVSLLPLPLLLLLPLPSVSHVLPQSTQFWVRLTPTSTA